MDFCGLACPETATPRTLRVRDTRVTQPRSCQDSGQNWGQESGLGREVLRRGPGVHGGEGADHGQPHSHRVVGHW